MKAPVVICPFSRTGDVTVGETPSDVALNLAAGTRIALSFNCKPVRLCPDVWSLFQTRDLSAQGREACRYLAKVYAPFRIKQPAP